MNFEWHKYRAQGVHETTGRKRTVKIFAHNAEHAEMVLSAKYGLMPPYTIEEEEFELPTDRQLNYARDLGIRVLPDMTKKDVSALIDKTLEQDTDAGDDLKQFAYDRDIYFSRYIGQKGMYNLLFSTLETADKTAFFCFSVYRSLTGESSENMDALPERNKFYDFADLYADDNSFQHSLEQYTGEDLIHFGAAEFGGSKHRKAYQVAANYINSWAVSAVDVANILTDEDIKIVRPLLTDFYTPEGFIVINNQVAMPEETVSGLLNVTIDDLNELVRQSGRLNTPGGVYVRDGKNYFASADVIIKLRDLNGRDTADLSFNRLFGVFELAEKKLMPEKYQARTKKRLKIAGAVFLAIFLFGMAFGKDSPPTQTTAPVPVKTETPTKPVSPKVETPEKSFYAESYDALRQATGLRVTEHYMLDYGERLTRDGTVDTHGFVEFNDDGVKRQFWLVFDGQTRKCLRVKIDSQLIYTAVGW